jgi:hypothetical protein
MTRRDLKSARILIATGTAGYRKHANDSVALAHVPSFSYGSPNSWVSEPDVEEVPTYESQAAYLEGHDLFLPGERRRLTKRDFDAERIDPEALRQVIAGLVGAAAVELRSDPSQCFAPAEEQVEIKPEQGKKPSGRPMAIYQQQATFGWSP